MHPCGSRFFLEFWFSPMAGKRNSGAQGGSQKKKPKGPTRQSPVVTPVLQSRLQMEMAPLPSFGTGGHQIERDVCLKFSFVLGQIWVC